jgi:hypothetical protein
MTRVAAVLLILGVLLLVVGVGLAVDLPAALMLLGVLTIGAGVLNLERRR